MASVDPRGVAGQMTTSFAQLASAPRVPWETDESDGQFVFVPDVCGPLAWDLLHRWAGAVHDSMCSSCGEFAIKAASAIHDAVNVKLGKPVHDAETLHEVALTLQAAAAGDLVVGVAQVAVPLPIPDRWGSRCRDDHGRWIPSDECGSPPADELVSDLTFAMGPNGVTKYDFQFRAVELEDLVVSHDPFTFEPNPKYPSDLQPRLRERAATKLQVQKIAQNLDADALLTDFRVLDRGAPIVGADLVVESGNGRVMALRLAAAEFADVFAEYRDQLTERSDQFGIAPETLPNMKAPVLVRVRVTDVDRREFTQEANTPATLSPSAIEQARTDAEKITLGMIRTLIVGETQGIEDALRSRTNRDFVQAFLAKLPDQEQARLVDAQGVLNQDGVRRSMMALFVSAFRGDAGLRLAERAFESTDSQVRNVTTGIGRALGDLAQSEALTREGERSEDLSIGDDLASAVNVFAKVKRTPGLSVPDYIAQVQLFDRELTDFQETILVAIDERSRSARRISDVLRGYAARVIETPPPQQGAFFPEARVTKEDLWSSAIAGADEGAIAAQRDPKQQVDWCNMTELELDAAWNWKPLREIMARAIGLGASVWACSSGLFQSEIQVTIDTRAISASEERQLQSEIERRLSGSARRVLEFGVRRLIYEVALPDREPEDLAFDPQEIIREPAKPAGVQPVLFQQLADGGGLFSDLLSGGARGLGFAIGSIVIERAAARRGGVILDNHGSHDGDDPDELEREVKELVKRLSREGVAV